MTTAAPEPGGIKASPTPRTTAHGHKRLAAVLGWTVTQVDKAVILGGLSLSRLHRGRGWLMSGVWVTRRRTLPIASVPSFT